MNVMKRERAIVHKEVLGLQWLFINPFRERNSQFMFLLFGRGFLLERPKADGTYYPTHRWRLKIGRYRLGYLSLTGGFWLRFIQALFCLRHRCKCSEEGK